MKATDLILVAVMPNKRDFEIARVLGWYRIPLATAPKTVNVDYLAFYQTAKFGAEKWAVNYVAPVRGHELTTRAELLRTEPDHPRANERYYRIQIGPLERLPRPIPSRSWRRITFLYSTGERLIAAEEINDLVVQSAEREVLWAALRERQIAAEREVDTGRRAGQVDFAILCELGQLGIVLGDEQGRALKDGGGWRYLSLPLPLAEGDLPSAMRAIEGAVRDLGGERRWAGAEQH